MTYEYLCTACQHGWEAEQSITAAPLKVCPACGQETARRQVSGGAGFILKGGGWYADLYGTPKKNGSSTETGKSESTSSASKSDSSASKSDSSASKSDSSASKSDSSASTKSEGASSSSTSTAAA